MCLHAAGIVEQLIMSSSAPLVITAMGRVLQSTRKPTIPGFVVDHPDDDAGGQRFSSIDPSLYLRLMYGCFEKVIFMCVIRIAKNEIQREI